MNRIGHEFRTATDAASGERDGLVAGGGGEQSARDRFVEIGPDNLEWIKLDTIHLLRQVRQEYDQNDIEELAYSIVRDNEALIEAETPGEISAALQLMHPLTLNRLQVNAVDGYLQEHANFYGLKQPEIMSEPDGPTIVNIAGHRRYLALEFIAVKLKGLSLSDVQVCAQVHDNLSFPEALALQLRENIKTNPPPQDEAKSIDRFYQYVTEAEGCKPSYKDVANRLGLKAGKVREAVAFRSLPEAIQDCVRPKEDGSALPYSLLVRFVPLQSALRERYESHHAHEGGYTELARDKDVLNDLHIMANKLAEMRLKKEGATRINATLSNKIRDVQGEIWLTAETLFDVEGGDTASRRQRSSYSLAKQAIHVLELLAKQGQLSDREWRQIETLRAVHAAYDNTPSYIEQDTMF